MEETNDVRLASDSHERSAFRAPCLAIEYGKQGLRANALCPGAVKTPIHDAFEIPEGADPKLLERIMPFSGFADPEAVASAVAFLASDDAQHVNGEELRIDGGMLS